MLQKGYDKKIASFKFTTLNNNKLQINQETVSKRSAATWSLVYEACTYTYALR